MQPFGTFADQLSLNAIRTFSELPSCRHFHVATDSEHGVRLPLSKANPVRRVGVVQISARTRSATGQRARGEHDNDTGGSLHQASAAQFNTEVKRTGRMLCLRYRVAAFAFIVQRMPSTRWVRYIGFFHVGSQSPRAV
jgi:hypothetical protein